MAYYDQGLQKQTASSNSNAPYFWSYESLNNADNTAAILTSGYFNDVVSYFNIGDLIWINASDGNSFAYVSALTPNVQLSPIPVSVGSITNASIAANAAIALSKLANIGANNIIVGNGTGVPTAVTMTGQASIINGGEFVLGPGVIGNNQVASNAEIVFSKMATMTPGQVVVGATTTGVPTATTLTGPVTVNGAGLTAIGAGQVTKAMLASTVQPAFMVVYAANYAWGGGSTTLNINIPGVLSTDIAFAQVAQYTTAAIIKYAQAVANTLTLEFDVNPGANTIIAYQILRATS